MKKSRRSVHHAHFALFDWHLPPIIWAYKLVNRNLANKRPGNPNFKKSSIGPGILYTYLYTLCPILTVYLTDDT